MFVFPLNAINGGGRNAVQLDGNFLMSIVNTEGDHRILGINYYLLLFNFYFQKHLADARCDS